MLAKIWWQIIVPILTTVIGGVVLAMIVEYFHLAA